MTQTIRLWVIAMGGFYLYGIFSGWYAKHVVCDNSNPDCTIHSMLMPAVIFSVISLFTEWRERSKTRKAAKKAADSAGDVPMGYL